MDKFDPRLLRVGVEVDGQINRYTGLNMSVSVTKFANALQNQATVKISNMLKSTRDYLLTETSPFNRPRRRKKLIIEAGRESTGYFMIYQGDITSSTPSQPPDIELTLKAATGGWWTTDPTTVSYGDTVSMDSIAKQVAAGMGLSLQNEGTPKNISNYAYSGSRLRQVEQINDMGYTTFVDDDTLYVTDIGKPVASSSTVLSLDNGMIGVPEITEQGVKVKFLLVPGVRIGGSLTVKSEINPAVNGDYIIFKLGYELANRDTPFYIIAEARRAGLWPTVR